MWVEFIAGQRKPRPATGHEVERCEQYRQPLSSAALEVVVDPACGLSLSQGSASPAPQQDTGSSDVNSIDNLYRQRPWKLWWTPLVV